MKRLIFRSTSIAHLEAELRQQELLATARRRTVARSAPRAPGGFRLRLPGLRGRPRG